MKNLTGVVPGALQMVFEAVFVKTADEWMFHEVESYKVWKYAFES